MKNGKEECNICKTGYIEKEGKCEDCSLENCIGCSLYEGSEKCYKCKEGYVLIDQKCFDCKILDKDCKSCEFSHYSSEGYKCFKCKTKLNYYSYEVERCLICSEENCVDCSFNDGVESCNRCKNGFTLDKDNGKCVSIYAFYSECSSLNLYNCKKCLRAGECIDCDYNYEINDNGKYKEKAKEKDPIQIEVYVVISIIVLILLIIIYWCCKKSSNGSSNHIRVNRNNRNNNIHNNNANLYIRNQNEQIISSNDILLSEKDLSDEFNRRKIKLENKLCQICKTENGIYIGDCGCIVCEKNILILKKLLIMKANLIFVLIVEKQLKI